jgi:hypothetical protein
MQLLQKYQTGAACMRLANAGNRACKISRAVFRAGVLDQ